MHHGMELALVALTLVGTPVFAEEAKPAPTTAEASSQPTLTLKKGGHQLLTLPGLVRVAVGDPDVADIKLEGKNVLKVTGSKAGETELVTWADPESKLRTYRIVVRD